jgi:hypothetical protein
VVDLARRNLPKLSKPSLVPPLNSRNFNNCMTLVDLARRNLPKPSKPSSLPPPANR